MLMPLTAHVAAAMLLNIQVVVYVISKESASAVQRCWTLLLVLFFVSLLLLPQAGCEKLKAVVHMTDRRQTSDGTYGIMECETVPISPTPVGSSS